MADPILVRADQLQPGDVFHDQYRRRGGMYERGDVRVVSAVAFKHVPGIILVEALAIKDGEQVTLELYRENKRSVTRGE